MNVREYLSADGKNPYREWLDTLEQLVLLLLGGDKSTQSADVARAQESWKAYQEGTRRGKTK